MRTSAITVLVATLLSLSIIACGGSSSKSSSPAPAQVSVSVTSPTTTVSASGSITFTAAVTGSTNTAVTWSVQEGSAGGTITQAGVYTAPATAGTYHVVATSQADTTVSMVTAVTVNPATVGITITPQAGPFYVSKTYQFAAPVTGSSNTAVTWAATDGTITTAGVYTPAALGAFKITATSQADSTKSATFSGTVTVPNPTFSSTPSTTLAQATATYTYGPITAVDPAGTAITYTLTSGPGSITGNTLSWTPTGVAPLTGREMPTSFTVTATTAAGGSATQTWTVTPLRAVTVNLNDSFWNAGLSAGGGNPSSGPLESIIALGAIVPGAASTCSQTVTIDGNPIIVPLTLCASSLTSATGTYTINNVPAGYYWLVNGPAERYWTNVSSFDASTDFIGQLLSAPTAAQPIDISGLILDATAAPNVSPNDVIWIGSPNTTAWWAPQTALPPTGTTLTDTTESIAGGTLPAINSAIVDGENADPSWALQFSSPSTGITQSNPAPLDFFGMSIAAHESLGSSFSYASAIGGTLSDATPQTLSFTTTNWSKLIPAATYTLSGGPTSPRLVYFGTYLASLPYTTAPLAAIGGGYPSCSSAPASSVITVTCTEAPGLVGWPAYTTNQPDSAILGTPHGQNGREAGGDFGPLFLAYAALDSSTCSASATVDCIPPDGDTVSMSVDNAFSSTGWPMVLSSQVEIQVPLGYSSNFSTVSTSQFSVTSLSSAIVDQPVIYPVTAPTINGNSLFSTPTTSLSAPLTLSWTAATLNSAITGGKIAGYDVMIYAAPTGSSAWGAALADLATTNTSVTVPTLGLKAGTYVVVIQARADANATLTAAPWHSKYPKGTAQIVSAPFTITGSW